MLLKLMVKASCFLVALIHSETLILLCIFILISFKESVCVVVGLMTLLSFVCLFLS